MIVNKPLALTYLYLLIYILLSSGVILYNKVMTSYIISRAFGTQRAIIGVTKQSIKLWIVSPVKMTSEIYITGVVPIIAFFAASLWFGNTACLYISVAFIQMLKALMPVATFILAVMCGTDKVMGIFAEALRLVLTQVLLQKKGLTLNPITSLYYIVPCSFVFLCAPWYVLEKPRMEVSQIQFNFWIFFSIALCALALNFSIFLVIGRTGTVTIRVAGVLKDWIFFSNTHSPFHRHIPRVYNYWAEYNRLCNWYFSTHTTICGVAMYNYLKVKDVHAFQVPENTSDRIAKDWKSE